ncbi:MAG TPA: ribosome maturation factor RimM [Sumerlaeia bacterium]|nr:ribosome maturation factor RimM [Sumerlaeia bacterium]
MGRQPAAGIPAPGPPAEDELLAIGAIAKPHGLTGELRVHLLCSGFDHFRECLEAGDLYLWKPSRDCPRVFAPIAPQRTGGDLVSAVDEGGPFRIEVESARLCGAGALVRIAGLGSRETAERIRRWRLGMKACRLPPAGDNTYYHFQLQGLTVRSKEGEMLGQVVEVLENPAHDHLVVKPSSPQSEAFLVPLIEAFVKRVDLDGGQIVVELPEGLTRACR